MIASKVALLFMKFYEETIKSIYLNRPLFFLCGPHIPNETDFASEPKEKIPDELRKARDADRRILVRNKILSEKDSSKNFQPLPIIADFLFDDPNLAKNGLILSLIEEIVASISFKTYLFLDTTSVCYELGFFSNHMAHDDLTVFLDSHYRERTNCPIGDYINKTIKTPKIYEAIYDYRGRIFFPNNEVPPKIVECIDSDVAQGMGKIKTDVLFTLEKESSETFGSIAYKTTPNSLSFSMSIKTFFYIVLGAFVRSGAKGKTNSLSEHFPGTLKSLLFYSFLDQKCDDRSAFSWSFDMPFLSIDIDGYDFPTALRHCLFVAQKIEEVAKEFVDPGPFEPYKLFYYRDFEFSGTSKDFDLFSAVFAKDIQSMEKIRNAYSDRPSEFVCHKLMMINGKKRNIATYKNNRNGIQLRKYHNFCTDFLKCVYRPPENVFGYIPNRNPLSCLETHKDSAFFLKLDFHHFFPSIKKCKCVSQITSDFFEIFRPPYLDPENGYFLVPEIPRKTINNLLGPCFFRGSLPIGFCSSPILSNMFLYSFDCSLIALAKKYGFVYTRYADDILISSEKEGGIQNGEKEINKLLSLYPSLTLNSKKTFHAKLLKAGDSIKFLGLVLTLDKDGERRIFVSKKTLKNYSINLQAAMKKRNREAIEKSVAQCLYVKSVSKISFEKLCHLFTLKTGLSIETILKMVSNGSSFNVFLTSGIIV